MTLLRLIQIQYIWWWAKMVLGNLNIHNAKFGSLQVDKIMYGSDLAWKYFVGPIEDATYDSESIATPINAIYSILFDPTGIRMFLASFAGDKIYQYDLTDRYDISTYSLDTSADVSGKETQLSGMCFGSDGMTLFVAGASSDSVHQYSLTTAYDITSITFQKSYTPTEGANLRGIQIADNGTRLFIVLDSIDDIYVYDLSTANDLGTVTVDSGNTLLNVDAGLRQIYINEDGKSFMAIGANQDRVYQYTLSTAFDLSTATQTSYFSVNTQTDTPAGFSFNGDKTKFFVSNMSSPSTVYQYSVN